MELTDAQYAWLKSATGSRCPSRDAADAMYEELGSVRAVALDILRTWRTSLIESPTSVSISGALSVSQAENIKALDRLIKSVEEGPEDPSAPTAPDGDLPAVGVVFGRSDFRRTPNAAYVRRR